MVKKKFSDLVKAMPPERQAKIRREAKRMEMELSLQKLRAARELTQANMARLLEVNQSEVSRIENRTDMYVSTLASYIEAMGGTLEVRAVFPDGDVVRITQFEAM